MKYTQITPRLDVKYFFIKFRLGSGLQWGTN